MVQHIMLLYIYWPTHHNRHLDIFDFFISKFAKSKLCHFEFK